MSWGSEFGCRAGASSWRRGWPLLDVFVSALNSLTGVGGGLAVLVNVIVGVVEFGEVVSEHAVSAPDPCAVVAAEPGATPSKITFQV